MKPSLSKMYRPFPKDDRKFSIMSFSNFVATTGVDLVITGTNITKQKPGVFSMRHTPNFPIAEAVGISMNIPVLFKPVFVEADVPVKIDPKTKTKYNEKADDYRGNWVDGGVLNNFPLHAFDFLSPHVPGYPDFSL